jgi:hypothetical protein
MDSDMVKFDQFVIPYSTNTRNVRFREPAVPCGFECVSVDTSGQAASCCL